MLNAELQQFGLTRTPPGGLGRRTWPRRPRALSETTPFVRLFSQRHEERSALSLAIGRDGKRPMDDHACVYQAVTLTPSRERLLGAAKALFAERGYEATSTATI